MVSHTRTLSCIPHVDGTPLLDTQQDSRSEKPARGVLFTALQRHLGNDRIVLVDALNYIKGFRYQMYCAAREAKVRVCTVRG